jgi:hypothetical protein
LIHKLLLKLSVAVLAASFTGQSVLADTYGNRNKGFFESLFGAPRYKKPAEPYSLVEEDGGELFMAGYGDEDYNDPEPFQQGWETSPIPPKLVL